MTPEKLKEAQQYIDFVKTNLEPLAEHLKVSVEWLWQILVNQVRVEAIVHIVVLVLLSIKATALIIIAIRSFKKATFFTYRRDDTTNLHGYLVYWCGGVGTLLLVVSTITTAVSMPKIVTGLVNPEYGALERVVQFSKGKVDNLDTQK